MDDKIDNSKWTKRDKNAGESCRHTLLMSDNTSTQLR